MYDFKISAGIKAQSKRINQAHDDGSAAVVNQDNFLQSWSDVPTSFKFILKNTVLILVTLGLTTEGMALTGFGTFLPKIIQNQFGQTASWSALLAGENKWQKYWNYSRFWCSLDISDTWSKNRRNGSHLLWYILA